MRDDRYDGLILLGISYLFFLASVFIKAQWFGFISVAVAIAANIIVLRSGYIWSKEHAWETEGKVCYELHVWFFPCLAFAVLLFSIIYLF